MSGNYYWVCKYLLTGNKEYKRNAILVPGQKLRTQKLTKIINKERGIIIGRKGFIAHRQPKTNMNGERKGQGEEF